MDIVPTLAPQTIAELQGATLHHIKVPPYDLSNTICFLTGKSAVAKEQMVRLAESGSKHIITKDEAKKTIFLRTQGDQGDEQHLHWWLETDDSHAIVLRMSAEVKDIQRGFQFGRNPSLCDIVFDNDSKKRLSNVHFRIYINSRGTIMFEDQSTNGSFVDGKFFRARNASRGPAEGHLTRCKLAHGSQIEILMHPDHGDLEFLVWIPFAEGRSAHAMEQTPRHLKTMRDADDLIQEPTNYHPSQDMDADVLENQPISPESNSSGLGWGNTRGLDS